MTSLPSASTMGYASDENGNLGNFITASKTARIFEIFAVSVGIKLIKLDLNSSFL